MHTAAAAASSLCPGFATRNAVVSAESWQPVPVMRLISGRPLRMHQQRSPSLTRSIAPVTAMMQPACLANALTSATPSSRFASVTASTASASTPLVVPLPVQRVLISEMLPRTASKRTSCMRRLAVSVRRRLAPAPTGSSRTMCPSSLAFLPARNMEGMVFLLSVPMLMFRPPQMLVMSSTSSASSDMIGEPPAASRTFATSLTVT